MQNKYINKKNTGIIFGKFYPIHNGHVYFIKEASKYVNELYVIVCSDDERDLKLFQKSKMKKMPTIEDRIRFVKETLKDEENVKIIHLAEDGITEYPNGWKDWSNRVEELLLRENIKVDMIFTNESQDVENYKINFKDRDKVFSKDLGIKTIDLSRSHYNISATKVRENPYENREFLPKIVREFFEF